MTFRLTDRVGELWLDLTSATADGKGMTVSAVTVGGNAGVVHACQRPAARSASGSSQARR